MNELREHRSSRTAAEQFESHIRSARVETFCLLGNSYESVNDSQGDSAIGSWGREHSRASPARPKVECVLVTVIKILIK